MERLEGQCHCGGVRVSVPGDAYGVLACHCDDCRRLHGNFFALLSAPTNAVQWSGDLQPQWYDSSAQARRSFCPRCGSRLAKLPTGGSTTLLSAGLFGRHLGRHIERQFWTESRPDWYQLPVSAAAPAA